MTGSVHRLVEQHASTVPDAIAIAEGAHATTYRELNARANALARRLCEHGLTRGALAFVRMPRCTDLAVVLLAVLKAGACYAWADSDDRRPGERLCILRGRSRSEEEYLAVDIAPALRDASPRVVPNLPVLTRGGDIACVLPDASGRPTVLVPHATITALPKTDICVYPWNETVGALDLWAALLSGATIRVPLDARITAAA